MKTKSLKLIAIAFMAAIALPILLMSSTKSPDITDELSSTGMGSVETLMARYEVWEASYVKDAGEGNIVLPLTPSRTLSTELVDAGGRAKINVLNGTVDVEIKDLPKNEAWDVWIIDNISGPNMSVMPEPGDTMIRLGSLKHDGKMARLQIVLDSETTASLDPDMAVVARAGKDPTQDRTLGGIITLYQELYLSKQRGNFGVLNDVDPPKATEQKPAEDRSLFARLIDAIRPTAKADIGPIINPNAMQQVINNGRIGFFTQTFEGNGRTCGTCHREEENFTIDAEFIATLPPNDPLFVAEFQPPLAQNFENPVLMRAFGLILENADGFSNLQTRFVMRGVPHTLALLDNTLTPVAGGGDGTTTPPNERTGWGGDGAPVSPPGQPFLLFDGNTRHADGSLIDFIIGAIIQHYPKTLARKPFTFPGAAFDFRLPTQAELNELVAFQKSTGRRVDPDLSVLQLKGAVPKRGQAIFLNGGALVGQPEEGAGKCNFCHFNAGASDFFFPGQNANFNTNVEQLPDQPADLIQPPQPNPPDGGFGQGAPPPGVFGFGNGSFNSPVLVEAADTGPFFHNNAVDTIEGAVDFYNSEAFNNPPGFGAQIGGIRLEATQVVAVAAFLRVLNTAENIRSAGNLAKRAKPANITQGRELLKLSLSETNDAIEVLVGGGLHGEAQIKLRQAVNLLTQAFNTSTLSTRNTRIDQAVTQLVGAMNDMIAVNVPAFQF